MNKPKTPIITLADKVVAFDVDDTLVMWEGNLNDFQPGPGKIRIEDDAKPDGCYYLTPHHKHIQKVKGYARSGYFVIIWSMSGGAWARNVAEVLKLTDKVDLIISKPYYLFDDMPLNEAFGQRQYFQPKKSGV